MHISRLKIFHTKHEFVALNSYFPNQSLKNLNQVTQLLKLKLLRCNFIRQDNIAKSFIYSLGDFSALKVEINFLPTKCVISFGGLS